MKTRSLILLTGLVLYATPAMAQREVQSANANPLDRAVAQRASAEKQNTSEAQKSRDARFARKVMQEFAQCVVDRHDDLALRFVLVDADQWVPEEEFKKLAGGKCLGFRGGRLKMARAYYRGALADELIRDELSKDFTLTPAGLAPLNWREPEQPPQTDRKTGKALTPEKAKDFADRYNIALAEHYVAQLGECVVRTDAAGARKVFDTALDSAEEIAALKALSPSVSGCVPEGQTLTFNRTNLRYALAVGYYRLADAQRATGATN